METTMDMKLVDFFFLSMTRKLEKMLEEEAALLAGVEDDVRNVVAAFKSITSLLKDMSTWRNLDDRQQDWVQEVEEVREVAYDAEDSIDEFVCRLRLTPERGVKGFFKHFLGSIKSLKARHDIASMLKKLKAHIEEVHLGVHDRYSHPNDQATSSGTAASLVMTDRYSVLDHAAEEVQLVGINQNRHKLIGWVMDENCPRLSVISLVGFGGLGKTTLAKTVYDDPIVRGHFQYRAWIVVSQNYSIKELLKKIILQIRDDSGRQDASLNIQQLLNMMDESQLVQTVRNHLRGKRYLLVFDDVWSTEAWESLSIALPPGKEGSRVVVTTRIEDVTDTSCSSWRQFILKISPLSPVQSWELFSRKVFAAPDSKRYPELNKVGIEIVQQCHGRPLAIMTVGGLLASKPLDEWKDLRDHFSLEIRRKSNIHQILTLSYNYLHCHLKPCFLFLGTFPVDYKISRKRLMRRWIAEGIVSGVGRVPAEKVAEHCFNKLVICNLVQPLEFDETGTVKSCRVHGMMLHVIISISRKENFVVLLNEQPDIPPQHHKIRRLSWHGGSSGLVPDTDLSHLRSFTAFGEDVPLKDFRNQRLLRAIDLEGCRAIDHLHPKSFSKLFLLKYLSLRNTGLLELPDSIGDLQNLEFLDIRDSRIDELPKTIVKLQKLVYLLAGSYSTIPLDKRLNVPKGIRKLKKLRRFGLAWADNVQLVQEIGELVELEKLAICFGDIYLSSEMAMKINAMFSKLSANLRSLSIFHDPFCNVRSALHGGASPPLLLCKLKIYANLGQLPAWIGSLNRIVNITLHGTQLQLDDLRVLRNLPTLVKLVLGYGSFSYDGLDLVFDQVGFTHLKFLLIESRSVRFKEGALQSLEIFKMIGFYLGEKIKGTEHLNGIKEFHIYTECRRVIEMVKNIAANHLNRPKCFSALSSTSVCQCKDDLINRSSVRCKSSLLQLIRC